MRPSETLGVALSVLRRVARPSGAPPADPGSRRASVRDALLSAVARVVSVAHPTNASGNNMSQR
jgi:hypothetical protein